MFVAKEPETGVPNLSFHRSMYISDEELRCRLDSSVPHPMGMPLGGRICCHLGPDEPSPLQTQDDQPARSANFILWPPRSNLQPGR
jgi:hypothetical protein